MAETKNSSEISSLFSPQISSFVEKTILEKKGILSYKGALMVNTGANTGRSTQERFIVENETDANSDKSVSFGSTNKPIGQDWADQYFAGLEKLLNSKPNHSLTCNVGPFKITTTSSSPWHMIFASNMFRQTIIEAVKDQISENIHIQVYHAPYASISDLGLDAKDYPHQKAIVLDVKNYRIGICGTSYAGEIKKGAFSMCNYIMPRHGIFPMHSGANCRKDGSNSCILFGLSGTGKTTLSADPDRYLIGDDEIIWCDKGLSNLEGGCYAKLIGLNAKCEPDIYKAVNCHGATMENVDFDRSTKEVDFDSDKYTENTRGSYPLSHLNQVFNQQSLAQSPSCIVFLVADAFGALPAVAKLNLEQAKYHFMSGYTAKVAGTELGVTEPTATFSACFGEPFMPLDPEVYGNLLSEKVKKTGCSIWMLNTGWVKGYGNSDRFPIPVSRALLKAIQNGSLDKCEMTKHPVFGFQVPTCSNDPELDKWLSIPQGPGPEKLAKMFKENADKKGFSKQAQAGGPKV